jgi:single-stranded DNA-binding protein
LLLLRRLMGGEDSQRDHLGGAAVWRHQAEHAAASLAKGGRVVVVGGLQQRSWTAEDGSGRSAVEVVAKELGPSLRWATATTIRIGTAVIGVLGEVPGELNPAACSIGS